MCVTRFLFTSSLGAALVVDTHTGVPDVQSKLAYNPLCVLLYEDPSRQPDHWENVSTLVELLYSKN